MQVLFGTQRSGTGPCGAVTFGNFDGVHLGHRALVSHLRTAAARVTGPSVVVTFDPHPLQVLAPDRAPQPLDTLDGRLQELAALQVDRTISICLYSYIFFYHFLPLL